MNNGRKTKKRSKRMDIPLQPDVVISSESDVDLSFLEGYDGLVSLEIVDCDIDTIDLSPLKECESLRRLVIRNCGIEEIDLTPLRNLKIDELTIRETNIKHLDLHPLNPLSRFKGYPLSKLDIFNESLKSVDVFPLLSCAMLDPLIYDRTNTILKSPFLLTEFEWVFPRQIGEDFGTSYPGDLRLEIVRLPLKEYIERFGWSHTLDIILHASRVTMTGKTDRKIVHRDVLHAIGLGWLSGVDTDIMEILKEFSDDIRFQELRSKLEDRLISILKDQIARGGPTIFIDIEEMRKTKHVGLVEDIVRLRNKEIEDIQLCIKWVYKGDTYFDPLPIWLTDIGYRMFTAMDMGIPGAISMNHRIVKKVIDEITEMGGKITLVDHLAEIPGKNMSDLLYCHVINVGNIWSHWLNQ